MEEKKAMDKYNGEFTIDSLKNLDVDGYLIFTDAAETGEDLSHTILITNNTRPGVDVALMNAGFKFEIYNNLDDPKKGLFWMHRGEKENLRYFPSCPFFYLRIAGMKTRIDFFSQNKSNAVYDVVSELLKLGYKVVLYSERLLFKPDGKIMSLSSLNPNNVKMEK